MASGNNISQKIDAYAKANLQLLKQEEAKIGRKMTKYDTALFMLKNGKLNKNEYANWMNTREGFDAQAITQGLINAAKRFSVFGVMGSGVGNEDYLSSLTSFSEKNPVEKQNTIFHRQMKLNETVAERKKKAAEINNHLKNERILKQINFDEKLAKLKLKALGDAVSDLNKKLEFMEELPPNVQLSYLKDTEMIKFNNEYDLLEYIWENYSNDCTSAEREKLLLKIKEEKKKAGKDTKISEEDKDKNPIELRKEIEKSYITHNPVKTAEPESRLAKIEKSFHKVLDQLLEKSPAQKKIRKDIKTIENIINNFPKNKAELKNHIKEYSKYANMDKVKAALFDNASYSDIKQCTLKELRWSLKHTRESLVTPKDDVYFSMKDVNTIQDDSRYVQALYCELFKSGYTVEQIQDMLPTLHHSVEEIKNIIGNGRYII